jgi:hypothetical protein
MQVSKLAFVSQQVLRIRFEASASVPFGSHAVVAQACIGLSFRGMSERAIRQSRRRRSGMHWLFGSRHQQACKFIRQSRRRRSDMPISTVTVVMISWAGQGMAGQVDTEPDASGGVFYSG